MAEPFLGQMLQVGFNYAPRGWALSQGQLLSIAQNSALFALLGTTFGGNGTQTFGLPDTRGRLMVGIGTGPGLSPIDWGQMSGVQTTALQTTNMPQHTHAATFQGTQGMTTASGVLQARNVTGGANNQTPQPTANAMLGTVTDTGGGGNTVAIYAPTSATGNPINLTGLTVNGGPFTPQGSVNVGPAGNGLPFSVLNPYVGLYTIIALQGIFPSRN